MEARHISIWIGIVRNNQIRKDRKGVSTTADNPYDFDRMINRRLWMKSNQIFARKKHEWCKNESSTNKTGFHFMAESSHKRIKQQFRRRFYTN